MGSVKISSLYSPLAVVAHPGDSLNEAASRMSFNDVGACAVIDEGELVGIITERDLTRSVGDGVNPHDMKVEDYMTADPATVDIGADAQEAARTMIGLGIRHLPVTERGAFVGLVSIRDILVEFVWSHAA